MLYEWWTASGQGFRLLAECEARQRRALTTGGVINAPRHEWRFATHRVCDGVDPEGTVIQVFERPPEPHAGW